MELCGMMLGLRNSDMFKWVKVEVVHVHYMHDWLEKEDECQITIKLL